MEPRNAGLSNDENKNIALTRLRDSWWNFRQCHNLVINKKNMSKNLEENEKIEIVPETLDQSQNNLWIWNQREELKKMEYPLILGIFASNNRRFCESWGGLKWLIWIEIRVKYQGVVNSRAGRMHINTVFFLKIHKFHHFSVWFMAKKFYYLLHSLRNFSLTDPLLTCISTTWFPTTWHFFYLPSKIILFSR